MEDSDILNLAADKSQLHVYVNILLLSTLTNYSII